MKIKRFLIFIFLAVSSLASAQDYSISKSVNIFGDTVIICKDGSGNEISKTTYSTDISGD
ncbi:hypothetical protein [Pedobacter sp. UYP30]|uniref:hypothetical protein n=1 Tax=Pedobacter sp. UYP30 TaxID=1756400 RepID=UPI003399CB6E